MKYINQRDDYACGAIATYNALAWAGKRMRKRKDYPKVEKGINCTREDGSEVYNIERFLKKCLRNGYSIRRKRFPKIQDIDRQLEKRGAIILCYTWGNRWMGAWGHYILIIRKQCGGDGQSEYMAVNEGGRTVEPIDRRTLRGYLKKKHIEDHFRGYYPDAIFISRKQK